MSFVGEIDAIEFNRDLDETYKRYLFTTNLISDLEPELKDSFLSKLGSDFEIVRGPYVHATPCYRPDKSVRRLVNGEGEVTLSKGMLDLPADTFDPDRPLYSHQVEAMSLLDKGRNLVVATGTGSGKTESYLLPILDSILKDPRPGLRAIIVYPLNALANDQLFRLRELLKEMPQVTFGRYTGETKEKPDQNDDGLPNERKCRSEIRESPPHILLTNFAMLEYLLLRPRDSELFENHNLKFIVLDEAHTYSGAQGIEIAMLMRRLKNHLDDQKNQIKFILTSATIGDGENGKIEVAKFASDLTGNKFEPQDVLSGETINSFVDNMKDEPSLSSLLSTIGDSNFSDWQTALSNPQTLASMLNKLGFTTGDGKKELTSKILYDAFSNYSPLAKIHDHCRKTPTKIDELCAIMGMEPTNEAIKVIRWLITLGASAKKSSDYAPLLPTRLHFFCRGLAGATLCLNDYCDSKKEHPQTNWSDFFLDDRNVCPTCEKKVLPIITCTHCGLPVVRIYIENGKWKKSFDPTANQKPKLLTWSGDVEEGLEESDDAEVTTNCMTLCLSCNQVIEGNKLAVCCEKPVHRTLQLLPTENDLGLLPTCPSCGGVSGGFPSVLREFTTAEDAPTAVLAEAMVRNLPFDKKRRDVCANGRKLLVFSDSRQRAAFFAPYLLQTTAETAFQGPLEMAIKNAEEQRDGKPVSFRKVAVEYEEGLSNMSTVVFKEKERGVTYYKLVPESKATDDDREAARYEAERVLYRNFCSSYKQKTTITGMGVATLAIAYPSHSKIVLKENLPELFTADEDRGWQILHALLELMVQRMAVDFPPHVKVNQHILTAGPAIYSFHLRESGRQDVKSNNCRQLYRWSPYLGPEKGIKRSVNGSRQLEILCKSLNLDKFADDQILKPLLLKIWDSFIKGNVLNEVSACPGEYRVNRECLAITTLAPIYACSTCGKLSTLGKLGFCTKVGCKGVPKLLSESEIQGKFEMNHYRRRFKQSPLPLEAREHTAQLTNEWGKVYQEEFNQGKVNVLSSSTTFEMGIDVGDLKAVMLRNFPPSASSYIQRTGRAGRRQDGVSIALTFARNVPHDQYNFHDPTLVIGGKINAPIINTGNIPLAQRHCNSMLLGCFLRDIDDIDGINLDKLTVDDFFVNTVAGTTVVELFKEWVFADERRTELLTDLADIIPADSELTPEMALNNSIESMVSGSKSVLEYHVMSELQEFRNKIKELRDESLKLIGNNDLQQGQKLATRASIMQKLESQFLEQRLIDFLSSCSWLPGYAFPQDIVKLKVLDAEFSKKMRLERDREVGISEYAPGAEIIADGKLFTSAGVEFKGQPDVRWWISCRECRRIETGRITDDPPTACTICGTSFLGASEPRDYIRPDGFTTSMEDPPSMPKLSRLRPPRSSEVFLLEGVDPESFVDSKVNGITYGIKKGGKLFRANSGRKFDSFLLCPVCGKHFTERPKQPGHDKPWGPRCNGKPKKLDLAHEIVTDILQLRFQGCNPPPPNLIDGRPFWRSLFAAFINGATDCLGIAPGDIDGTYHGWSMESYIGEIVVYDRIPGGAGHIERIVQNIDDVLYSAYRRVKDCSCSDIDSSCYACLRSYSNQFYWDELLRRPVIEWLEKVLQIEE
ncbi:DEAD/DEAH box helicase [Geobacter sulfurreducens]|uniref:DEAD/DEAH box helicase n=1 Tax=Geobacter sulfurreducens TaxID=35554 RepID=UPI002C925428|nr:DEAD/DEAH box helicase [Geobacter sulfurreducens]HML78996.1 DEAD/DEAH box helicase [Geobacter sulfurreducens]